MVQYSGFSLETSHAKLPIPHTAPTPPRFRKPTLNSRKQVVSLPLQLWMPVEARLQEQRDRHDVHIPKVRLQPESNPNQKD